MSDARVSDAGDRGLVVRLGGDDADRRLLALAERLVATRPPGVVDVVPSPAELLVIYDPFAAERDVLAQTLTRVAETTTARDVEARLVEIPALYDAAVAPDLDALTHELGLEHGALVALHSGTTYRCAMLGFRPGFPYLVGLPPALHVPRLPSPRARVPAGSVALGGPQTGVYPIASPGGWRILARTPLRVFDPERADPFLVHAGDDVRFVPIDRARFLALGGRLDEGGAA